MLNEALGGRLNKAAYEDREEVALSAKNALLLDGMFNSHSLGQLSGQSSGLSLPKDRTITISIIAGPSKGLTRKLTKPKTSIGHVGGGADIEINDPEAARVHCVVGLTEDTVRLCDLDSANGTYVDDERIQAADLEHLSEFRVGSTWLIVSISRKNSAQSDWNEG